METDCARDRGVAGTSLELASDVGDDDNGADAAAFEDDLSTRIMTCTTTR